MIFNALLHLKNNRFHVLFLGATTVEAVAGEEEENGTVRIGGEGGIADGGGDEGAGGAVVGEEADDITMGSGHGVDGGFGGVEEGLELGDGGDAFGLIGVRDLGEREGAKE